MVSAWSVQTATQVRLAGQPVTVTCPALQAPTGGIQVPGIAVQAWLAAVRAASDGLQR